MNQKPTGYFSGSFELIELINPTPAPSLPWFVRFVSWLLGGFGSPAVFLLEPDEFQPLTYFDSTGRVFVIGEAFEFDGATTPRVAWIVPGLSPWDWTRAAAFHDYLFHRHNQGRDVVGFDEANQLLGEMCRTLGVSEWKILIVVSAVNRFGKFWWKGQS
jgi:hypothetical protein